MQMDISKIIANRKLGITAIGLSVTALTLNQLIINSTLIYQLCLILFLASSIYLIKTVQLSDSNEQKNLMIHHTIPSITFFCLFAGTIIIVNQQAYSRPLIFLMLIAIMSGLLAVEIISMENICSPFILAKIFIIAILLRATLFYQFPSQVGLDPWFHASYIEQLLVVGHLGEYFKSYHFFPIMHVFGAIISQIAGMDVKNSYFFIGIISTFGSIFIYILARSQFEERIALLSVLMLLVSSEHIQWGYWIIPMSYGIALFPMVMYLISSISTSDSLHYREINILILVITILTHTVTSVVTLAFLAAMRISYIVYLNFKGLRRPEKSIEPISVILFAVLLISYWMYASGFIGYIAESIKFGFSMDSFIPHKVTRNIVEYTLERLALYTFAFFSIIGFLYILEINRDKTTILRVLLSISAIIISFFVVGGYILNFTDFLPTRWFVFIFILSSMACAVGLNVIAKKRPIFIFILMIMYSFIMITSYSANLTDDIIPLMNTPCYALKYSEMKGANTICNHTDIGNNTDNLGNCSIYTDAFYANYISKICDSNKLLNSRMLIGEESIHGTLILRNEMKDRISLLESLGVGRPTEEFVLNQSVWHSLIESKDYFKIYDSNTINSLVRV